MESNAEPMASPLKRYTLTNLMENMIYRLPGCTELMIRKELQHTLIEFCEITGSLVLRIPIDYKEGANSYLVSTPSVNYTIRQINSFSTTWGNYKRSTDFAIYKESDKYYVSFNVKPNSNDLLENMRPQYVLECVCVPTINAENVPEDFLKRFSSALVSGTMARLMSMSGKAWSDVSQAAIKNIEYQNALNDACVEKVTQGRQQITFARGNFTSWF